MLNYNGRDLLAECLPSVLAASKKSAAPCSVTVIDNCSADDSVEFLRNEFPDAKVFLPKKNRVLCSFNEAVRESRADIVLLFNNDLKVDENFLAPLVEVFQNHPDAFFTAPKVLFYETGRCQASLAKMEFRWGLLWGSARFGGSERTIVGPTYTMQCGNGAFHRERFLAVGGYDDLYLPGTVEDTDLCFRGWRRGWKGYYAPASVIHHMGQTTFKKEFGASGIRRINRRNLYLFVWKNVRNPVLLAQHFLFLPAHLLRYCVLGQFDFVKGFFEALRLLPKALQRRRLARLEPAALSDRMIFAISKEIH